MTGLHGPRAVPANSVVLGFKGFVGPGKRVEQPVVTHQKHCCSCCGTFPLTSSAAPGPLRLTPSKNPTPARNRQLNPACVKGSCSSELRVHAAGNVVVMFVLTFVVVQISPIFDLGLMTRLQSSHVSVISAASERGSLKSSKAFCTTVLKPSISYSVIGSRPTQGAVLGYNQLKFREATIGS
ncbi:hypothetical protein TNCV_1911781 [Trichonephila clavipes]|nr:hypothetical protein TNCV_1911781 [Trichonephila clavipes]